MKVNEHWLKSFVDYPSALPELADALTYAGIEVEHVEPLESTRSVLTLKIPPNRGDCLSVEGLAREIAAITQTPLKAITPQSYPTVLSEVHPVEVYTPICQLCHHAVISGLDNTLSTPDWILERLRMAGIAPVSVLMDILAFVMLELGQPFHAFDRAALQGSLLIKNADGSEHLSVIPATPPVIPATPPVIPATPPVIPTTTPVIPTTTLVIPAKAGIQLDVDSVVMMDQKGVHALAGVIGDLSSMVSSTSTDVLLVAACFDPIAIRQAAQRYHRNTEASYRFERGIDPSLSKRALERALLLITQITHAKVGPIASSASSFPRPRPSFPRPRPSFPRKRESSEVATEASILDPRFRGDDSAIFLPRPQIQQLLGLSLDDQQIISILTRLNMQVIPQADGFDVQPPSYRLDLKRSVDLIEELGRIYGFDRIPAVDFCGTVKAPVLSDQSISDRSLKNLCVNRGYSEIMSYSFIDPIWADRLGQKDRPCLLANPLSQEMAMMRSTLWPGLLTALQHNQHRQIKRARLFEMGTCFVDQAGSLSEVPMLAGLCVGSVEPEQWGLTARPHDFYDVKGDIEALISLLGSADPQKHLIDRLRFEAVEVPALQIGQSAAIYYKDEPIGMVGALHPRIAKSLDLQGPVWLFEIKRSAFVAALPSFVPLSKFPSVRRDIALLVSKTVQAESLKQSVLVSAGPCLQQVLIFDVYENKALDAAQKSVGLALIFQHPSRTLEEAEIKILVEAIVQNLVDTCQASLRE